MRSRSDATDIQHRDQDQDQISEDVILGNGYWTTSSEISTDVMSLFDGHPTLVGAQIVNTATVLTRSGSFLPASQEMPPIPRVQDQVFSLQQYRWTVCHQPSFILI